MRTSALAATLAALALSTACRRKPAEPSAAPEVVYAPPEGRRAFSLSIDKSQTRFLSPGDDAEVSVLVSVPRADGASESRLETLAARAQVLRVDDDWSDDDGLIQLALSPEEAEYHFQFCSLNFSRAI